MSDQTAQGSGGYGGPDSQPVSGGVVSTGVSRRGLLRVAGAGAAIGLMSLLHHLHALGPVTRYYDDPITRRVFAIAAAGYGAIALGLAGVVTLPCAPAMLRTRVGLLFQMAFMVTALGTVLAALIKHVKSASARVQLIIAPVMFLAGALLGCALVVGPLVPQPASAQLAYCRSDPFVFLSNGMKVTIVAQINSDPSAVGTITYSLSVPAGASVTGVTYTGGALQGKETLRVTNNSTTTTYSSGSLITTTPKKIGVQATTSVLNTNTDTSKSTGTVSGLSGQSLTVSLNA